MKNKKVFYLFVLIVILITQNFNVVLIQAATIKLNKTNLILNVGEKEMLKVTGTTNTVEWSSSDKSVAKVYKNGNVEGVKVGKTTITATVGKNKYRCNVKVICISDTDLSIYVNDTYSLLIKGVKDNNSIIWTSNDDTLATVDNNGMITALKEGTTTITGLYKNKNYTCEVSVKKKELTTEDYSALGWVAIRNKMKNPNSLTINSIKIGNWNKQTANSGRWVILFDYSAQNSFGGMTRSYAYIMIEDIGKNSPKDIWFATLMEYGDFKANNYLTIVFMDSIPSKIENLVKINISDIESQYTKYLEEDKYVIYN